MGPIRSSSAWPNSIRTTSRRGCRRPRSGAHRQGGHRRPAGARPGARRAQAGGRSGGADRGSRQARSRRIRGCAASRQGRPRPGRSRAGQALPARHVHPKDPELLLTGGKILLKLDNLDGAREHLERFLAVAPKAVEEVATLGDHLASPNARYGSSTCSSTTPRPRVTSARPPGSYRGSWRRRRGISRRYCVWSKSASTATSTPR